MFISTAARSASAYKVASVESSVEIADSHGLICLLFDALFRALRAARTATENGDIPVKCKQIGVAIRLLEDGLILGLNPEEGGDLATNLKELYSFCVVRLAYANAKNDAAAIVEVERIIEPISDGWRQIRGATSANVRPL